MAAWSLGLSAGYTLLTFLMRWIPGLQLTVSLLAIALAGGALLMSLLEQSDRIALDYQISRGPFHGLAPVFMAAQVVNILEMGMYKTAWLRFATVILAAAIVEYDRRQDASRRMY